MQWKRFGSQIQPLLQPQMQPLDDEFIFENQYIKISRSCSALVEKAANLKVMRVCNTLITFKFALLQGTAEQLRSVK